MGRLIANAKNSSAWQRMKGEGWNGDEYPLEKLEMDV